MSDSSNNEARRAMLNAVPAPVAATKPSTAAPAAGDRFVLGKADYAHQHPSHKHMLKAEEQWEVEALFSAIDADGNGTIENDELSVLHGFDREGPVLTPFYSHSTPISTHVLPHFNPNLTVPRSL